MTRPGTHQSPGVQTPRRGIATIELVMSFPVLVYLAVMIFSLGNAHFQRSSAAITIRKTAWAHREQPNAAVNPVLQTNQRGSIYRNQKTNPVTRVVTLPRFFSGIAPEKTAESRNVLIMGTWTDDNPNVGFKAPTNGIRPHLRSLGQLTHTGNAVRTLESFLGPMDALLSGLETVEFIGNIQNAKLAAKALLLVPHVFEGLGWAAVIHEYLPLGFLDVPVLAEFMTEAAFELRKLSRWID